MKEARFYLIEHGSHNHENLKNLSDEEFISLAEEEGRIYSSEGFQQAFNDEEIFEMATNFGAKECFNYENYNEIITEKEDFYKIKSKFEKQVKDFVYSGIEWRPLSYVKLNKEQSLKIIDIFETLEEIDDVQNIFLNVDLRNLKL